MLHPDIRRAGVPLLSALLFAIFVVARVDTDVTNQQIDRVDETEAASRADFVTYRLPRAAGPDRKMLVQTPKGRKLMEFR
jgi:hypothetical protein